MTGIDLARAILAKLERDRQVPTVLPATVVGLDDDPDSQPIPLAHVEVDGNPPGMVNVIPVATAGRLAIGQRVLVHFDPPSGAYIIGTITRGAGGGGRPYATVVVAAGDSVAADHELADVVCPGDDSDIPLIAAIMDTLNHVDPLTGDQTFVGGRVLLLEGTYFGPANTLLVSGDALGSGGYPGAAVELAGMGPGSRLVFTSAPSPESVGVVVSGGVLTDLALLNSNVVDLTPFLLTNGAMMRHVVVGLYDSGGCS